MIAAFPKAVLFQAILCSPVLLPAQAQLQWSEPIVVLRGTQDQIRPRIVLNAELRPVILWGEASPAANYIAVGEGNAFSTAQVIHPPTLAPAVADWQGSDLISSGDRIYAIMKMTPENSAGIYLVSSLDGGYTWSDTLRVDQVPGYKTRFSSIAIDPNGDPLVQYMQIDMSEVVHRNMVSKIIDGVVQPPIDVSSPFTAGEDCDCCPGQIISDGNDVAALFRDATENVRVIWAATSANGGGTFDQGAPVDDTNWILNACPASGPDGVISADSLYTVWMSGAVNGKKVYLGSSRFPDLAQGAMVQVHPAQPQSVQQDHPRIAGSVDTIGIVWQQTASTQSEVLFSWRTAATELSEPDTINIEMLGPQRSPDITFANGTFHMVWADYQENAIIYRKATLMNSIGIQEDRLASDLNVWPVPASDVLHIGTRDQFNRGNIKIYDALGHLVLETPFSAQVQIDHLQQGGYSLQVFDRNGMAVGRSRFTILR
ncbi:MAG: T9SS type A sorting domain-containing protein [Bacteroidota bacterium]|nr:T9SS type A sorting domain-containing protein [Bacteroidota bacterium]